VSSSRPRARSAIASALIVVIALGLGGLLAVPISASNASVTGSLTYLEKVALSPAAVAIVTIVDQTAAPDAGAVIGQERIDGPTTLPIDFSVLVDATTIDPTHAYAVFATIVDGTNSWQNPHGEPVITGGPIKGIDLVLTAVSPTLPATVAGSIVLPAGAAIGPAAVAIAALIKVDTGTLVSRQVRPITDPADLAFSIGFDPALIDPAASYVVKGGIVDGATAWQNRDGVSAIANGAAAGPVLLPVTQVATALPVGSAFPTAIPSQTAGPTASPTVPASPNPSETAGATSTPAPTATPAPIATPAPTETPAPTPSPTAVPTATPSPSPTTAPSNAPTPSPISGPVTGTLTYREPYKLSADAFAVVALVRGSARADESSIVVSEIDHDVNAVPVSFSLAFDPTDIDPSVTYTIQATIVDGANAWVTSRGVPVLTKGNPTKVAITLGYRPDLLKGAVTGQITAVGLRPSTTAYAMAILVDPATGDSLGIDAETIANGLPQAFAIPYTITDVDPTQDYVVTAEVGDQGATWRNEAGVPVLTKGNPKTAIEVVVTQVAIATPSPSATPTAVAAPLPSAAPVPTPSRTGSGDLLLIIILIAAVGAIAAFLIARGRNASDAPTPGADRPTDQSAPTPDEPGPPPDEPASAADEPPNDEAPKP
jgi:uncharacterized lipoprotein YbaY